MESLIILDIWYLGPFTGTFWIDFCHDPFLKGRSFHIINITEKRRCPNSDTSQTILRFNNVTLHNFELLKFRRVILGPNS